MSPYKDVVAYELVALPPLLTYFLILIIGAFFSATGFIVIRKIFPSLIIQEQSRLATTLLSIIGALTAFTISFVVVNAWIKYQEQVIRLENEAIEISNFYRDCFAYPPEKAKLLHSKIIKYNEDLIEDGWPRLEDGKESTICRHDINLLYNEILKYEPQTEIEKAALKVNLDHIHKLIAFRKLRLRDSQNPIIHNILWYAILAGFFLTMLTTYFLSLNNLKTQIILTAIYALSVSTLIFVGLQLNYPYRGSISVKPDPLIRLKEEGFSSFHEVFDKEKQ